ncbi:MAG: septal ring lytic transglycosylase RlpA family protein [Kiloniellales bacterium]
MRRRRPGSSALAAAALAAAALTLSGCAETELVAHVAKELAGGTEQAPPQGAYKIGEPYQIDGAWYEPREDFHYDETGIASWYGPDFHGRLTANGEVFDQDDLTAAHPTLPMPSLVRVTNLENGRSVVVRVNDRGPFVRGRIIDMSRQAARLLGFESKGTAKVRVSIMGEDSRRLKRQMLARADGPRVAQATPVLVPAALPAWSRVRREDSMSAFEQQQLQVVSHRPVAPSAIYVQAGAFTNFDNADRLRAGLGHLGPTTLTPVVVDGRQFFRVRIGPLAGVDNADALLRRVIDSGHPEAGIVVE